MNSSAPDWLVHRMNPDTPEAKMAHYKKDRDRWIRAFNRLEAAITHHKNGKHHFTDDVDDALYAARDRIMSNLANASK